MSIFGFKIKVKELKVEIKEHDWEISYPASNRKTKTCAICGYVNKPGAKYEKQMATFTKRKTIGDKKAFETHYTCNDKSTLCTEHMIKKLNIKL